MTVVAAACSRGRVWMASDSDNVDGAGRTWPDARKIITVESDGAEVALLGHTGRAAVQHRVRQRLAREGVPVELAGLGDDAWADAFGECVDAWARAAPSLEEDGDIDSSWILGRAGRLWSVRPGYATSLGAYSAIGSGGDLALGVLFGRLEEAADWAPEAAREAVVAGVRAAMRFDESCQGEVVVRGL